MSTVSVCEKSGLTDPHRMLAVELPKHRSNLVDAIRGLRVVEKPIPPPGPSEVLIKIAAAPCNPSDLYFLQGLYGITKQLPTVPGWEGAGTVVQAGDGLLPKLLQGRRVACAAQTEGDGTWAEYYVVEARNCIPLSSRLSFDQGAMLVVNPLTALGLMEQALEGGHSAAVQTAGASQVGRMLIRLARLQSFPLINIVRREEQVSLLRDLGAENVLNSTNPSFDRTLADHCRRLDATIAFEAVAGEMTGLVLNSMPHHAVVLLYGFLSQSPCNGIDPAKFLFGQKQLQSFWLTKWIYRKTLAQRFLLTRRAQRLIEQGILNATVHRRVSFEELVDGLLDYHADMTQGKVLLIPSLK